jgi:hypothetical protein
MCLVGWRSVHPDFVPRTSIQPNKYDKQNEQHKDHFQTIIIHDYKKTRIESKSNCELESDAKQEVVTDWNRMKIKK